jgi:glutamate--cysteine ligase
VEADLREEDAEAYIHGVCFKTGPPLRTGVELEWLVHDRADPRAPVAPERLDAALTALGSARVLPRGGVLTREPGGQIELSSAPAATLADCVHNVATDLAVLRHALAARGLDLVGEGLEPHREPPRVLDHPRYGAMEAHFDRAGPWGRVMMRSTAALQVSLDAGEDGGGLSGYRCRWELAHRLGPVLVAAFANSPVWRGRPTGWCSTRQAVWGRMAPDRTRAPHHDGDPRAAWARYALDAQVMCVRRPSPQDWVAPPGLTFRSWLRGAAGFRRPTQDDLDYHLTTLFPPVRPRGWLELRMIDAQSGDDWQVATALTAVLMDDPTAADYAYEATEPLCGGSPLPNQSAWTRAARFGPADPDLGKAVRACLTAAEAALGRAGAPPALRRAAAAFVDRYPERGRCPAHDRLDALRRGTLPPPSEGRFP